MIAEYHQFLDRKQGITALRPAPVEYVPHPNAKPHQEFACRRLIEIRRGAAFLDTGLGKTFLQLDWARHIPGEVLIIAPLAVGDQTVSEARRLLGLEVAFSQSGEVTSQITITNYDQVQNFDVTRFAGVVLDESSILKGQTSKTRQWLTEAFRDTQWKLCCTATPAPNDHTELGNHAEFLGIMTAQEMLMRWFIHDSANTNDWRIKGHAETAFWQWVGSWAVCASMPSDLGFSDEGYVLPPLNFETHIVRAPMIKGGDGELFGFADVSATGIHSTKKLTLADRCHVVADLVNASTDAWSVWCESNEESAMLKKLIPDAVEVKGSDSPDHKRDAMKGFSEGRHRVIVSKPSICGFGMNWQHCHNVAVASVSHSYERLYQLVRRHWRFGQSKQVNVHAVIPDVEIPVWKTVQRKTRDHDAMKSGMRIASKVGRVAETKIPYRADYSAALPNWLVSANERSEP